MIWDGFNVFTLWGYVPDTKMAIKWGQRADTNWRGCDRGDLEDKYLSNVVFQGPEAELIDLETVLNNNRTSFLINLNSGEEIFGADLDYSGDLTVIVTDYGKIRKTDFKIFEMALTLRVLNPVFLSTTPDFTKLRKASHSDTRETKFELTKLFTYDNDAFVVDRLSNDGKEAGIYTAVFEQTREEMAAIRRYLTITARANKIVFPTFDNLTYPWGTRAGTGPFNCRIIDWRDLGRIDFCDWKLSITFARDLSYWNE